MSEEKLQEVKAPYVVDEYQSRFAALGEDIYQERVIRARRTAPAEKILAGQRLFESACAMTLAGIRNQHPGITEARCQEILRERLAWRRRRQAVE